MSAQNRDRLRRYEALKGDLERLLYEYDPEGMGSTAGAPLDEYSDVALSLMRALRDDTSGVSIAETVRQVVPEARSDLVGEIEKRWNASRWSAPP